MESNINDKFTSFFLLVANFKTVKDIIPNIIPSAILYASGIIVNVKNAGIAFVKSLKSIFVSELAIITPTNISTGAVACVGIAVNIGAKNNESKNINPVVIAVNPVLPPSPIPDALSTNAVTVDVAYKVACQVMKYIEENKKWIVGK